MCLQLSTTAMGRVYILTETETKSGFALSLKTRMYFILSLNPIRFYFVHFTDVSSERTKVHHGVSQCSVPILFTLYMLLLGTII